MANKKQIADAVREIIAEDHPGIELAETTTDALLPLQESELAPSVDAAIMETLLPEPEAPGENAPCVPYVIVELGIQPVALASRTFASDFGPGGAAHTYKTAVYGEDGAIVHTNTIKFQNGALGALGGINGMADSTLLSILADRLTAFQAGPFASEQTGNALECVQQAAAWLNQRTADRQARGVQGKHTA